MKISNLLKILTTVTVSTHTPKIAKKENFSNFLNLTSLEYSMLMFDYFRPNKIFLVVLFMKTDYLPKIWHN